MKTNLTFNMKLLNDDLDIAARRAKQFRELEKDGIPVFDTHEQDNTQESYSDYYTDGGIWFKLFLGFFIGGLVFGAVAGLAAGVFFFFKWVVNLL